MTRSITLADFAVQRGTYVLGFAVGTRISVAPEALEPESWEASLIVHDHVRTAASADAAELALTQLINSLTAFEIVLIGRLLESDAFTC